MIDWIKSKLSELKNAVKEAREIDRNASKFWKLADNDVQISNMKEFLGHE